MTEEVFISRNESEWKSLEVFVRRLNQTGVKKLPGGEVRTFARLFRLAGYHLAYAKTHYPGGRSYPYLNKLVGVAHNHFYIRESGGLSQVKDYLLRGFPEAARGIIKNFYMSAALFLLGALFAAVYVALSPERMEQIMPGLSMGGELGEAAANWDYPLMSAVIMANNISVSFTAFVLGVSGGIGTVIVLIYNGLILGGLAAALAGGGGDMLTFFALILPHGVWELAAIFLSGACGLTLGRAVLVPGRFKRKDALIFAAKKASALIPGIVLMLILAGLIEGFFTPLAISPVFKLLFAGLTLAGLVAYWVKR
ncbi:MAG: stage II sporulation protein M [Clostridiales bacterium]|jgi:uncharacterized membrane protein SpoIIM required for sporulation|nr:stage II sporulation protein M [Clostridiales bacterium]